MRQRFLWALILVAMIGVRAEAGKHPVPLDPKADPATCLECHEDKTKGKSVHSAMAMGCTSCHEIRVNREVTRTKLKTTTSQALCLSCHEGMKAAANVSVHEPVKRDCVKCHSPHVSENKNQLLKPTSGAKGENLCLNCHAQGVKVPEKGSRHAALDMGCETCHLTHKAGDPTKRDEKFHLTKDAPALCLDCHDPKDETIAKAHQNQPIANANCLTCHDAHQSATAKLAPRFTHMPFAEKSCDSCHEQAKEGKVVLLQADARQLCMTCHEEAAKKIESAKVPHAGAMGACTDCHDAHAGKSPGFLKPNPVQVCTTCHADQAEMHKSKAIQHQPAFEQGCATCHAPHGGENEKLLRAKTPGALCLECHAPDAEPKKVEGQDLVTIFGGTVRLPANYFAKVVRLPIKYGRGHPVDKHPVVDQMEPTDVSKVRLAINCASCHQPHASSNPGLLVKDQANNLAFCASCHKDLGR